ncbi:MAG: phospholipase D-like domain-containing protein [Woeseiaceae bacterium]|nr:phospholipase D-like domain-containing protein [Woeseiaceae bacterium]
MTTIPTLLLVLIHIGPATWGVYHALLYKRDPRSAMGWIMACIFIPYGGPVAYFLFGINRVRSRARGLQRRFPYVSYELGERRALQEHAGAPGLPDAGWRVTGRVATDGNDVTALHNGDAAYPAMLQAIDEARERVYLATYILQMDGTGRRFADALAAAARRGVDVRVLVDGIGELYSWRRASRRLKKRGVNTARFLPPRLIPPSIYVNLRNHRKLLIADSAVAFAGGMNIADYHTTTDEAPRSVTDTHFALRGPVVSDLADLFRNDWRFATGSKEDVPPDTPPPPAGESRCRIVPDGPDEELDALAITIQTVISAAERSVDIMTPYFLPNRAMMAALESAALRGVRVRVLLPKRNNLIFVHWAHQNTLAELLRWNIEAWYQPEPFCHGKILCIDDDYTLIGSANLDSRSLRLNFELGVEVFSASLASELRAHFDALVDVSHRITYEELAERSIATRLRDSAAALFSPYL